jgi:phage terminase Nu1 subunit (DNA packaging protein)
MAIRILNGWKEISSHLNRDVRTVQRWERHFGMPVHRPARKPRAAVSAFPDELDSWLVRTKSGLDPMIPSKDADGAMRLGAELQRLQAEAQLLSERVSRLENQRTEKIPFDSDTPLLDLDDDWRSGRISTLSRRTISRNGHRAD